MPKICAAAPLSRFRVLDLSRVRAGPTCVRMLADFGADVIRIEPPPGIDPNEAMFAADRLSGDFQNLNRNKWCEAMNAQIKTMASQEHALVADVYAAMIAKGDLTPYYFNDVHPNDAGYDVIAQAWFDAITKGKI